MSLSKTLYPLLSTGSTQEDRKLSCKTEKLLTGMYFHKKQNNMAYFIEWQFCIVFSHFTI